MVLRTEPTIRVKGRVYKVDEIKSSLLQRWKLECYSKFPLDKTFDIALIDPPWEFRSGNYSKSKTFNGLATYPTQPLIELKALPVRDILNDPGAVFLWCTPATMLEAMELINCWKLKFVTVFHVWVKIQKDGTPVFGTGAYVRNSSEFLLLARHGNGLTKKIKNHSTRQVVFAPRLKHSEKPQIFQMIIENFFDLPKRIELYARSVRPGWSAWGLEVSDGKKNHFYYQDPGYKDPHSTSTDSSKTLKKTGGNPENVPMDEYVIEEFKLPKQYFVEHGLTGVL